MGCVYQAKNLITGKLYIGKTALELCERKYGHEYESKKPRTNSLFHKSIRKYGIDNFEWTELFQSEDDIELCKKEIEFIELLRTLAPGGYNLTIGGDGIIKYRTQKEREEVRQKAYQKNHQQYYKDHKEHRQKYNREYYEDYKDEINRLKREHYAFLTLRYNETRQNS